MKSCSYYRKDTDICTAGVPVLGIGRNDICRFDGDIAECLDAQEARMKTSRKRAYKLRKALAVEFDYDLDYDKIWSKLNDNGAGFSLGEEDDSINGLRGVGKQMLRGEYGYPAVYWDGREITIVADAHGPWAVAITPDKAARF